VIAKNRGEDVETLFNFSTQQLEVLLGTAAATAVAAVVLSFAWMIVVRYFARALIILTLALSVAIVVINAIVFFVKYGKF
jgi:hypothetical protein